jgi:hypothetical protein
MHPSPSTFGRREKLPPLPPLGQEKRTRKLPPPRAEKPPKPAPKANFKAPPKARQDSEFAAWRKAQAPRSALFWLASLALMAPGLACFLAQAPLPLSVVVELAGVAGGAWLRGERKRRLAEIAAWESDQGRT